MLMIGAVTAGEVTAGAVSGAAKSSGCAHPAAAGTTTQALQVGSTVRTYRLAVPSGAGPFGLVLNFHGLGSNAVEEAVYSQLEQQGPADGEVVATPQGTGSTPFFDFLPNVEFHDLFPNVEIPDDVAFSGQLIDHLEQTLCIDPTRVYSTGISDGAALSTLLGCRLAGRLAAIAPVAGINLVAACPHGTPLSVMAFHGTADALVPYNGGNLSPVLFGLPSSPVPTAVASWARRDHCGTKPSTRSIGSQVTEATYLGCSNGTQVILYTILGGGHTWPGSPFIVPGLGPVTSQINAADLMLAFFRPHDAARRDLRQAGDGGDRSDERQQPEIPPGRSRRCRTCPGGRRPRNPASRPRPLRPTPRPPPRPGWSP